MPVTCYEVTNEVIRAQKCWKMLKLKNVDTPCTCTPEPVTLKICIASKKDPLQIYIASLIMAKL